MDKLPKPDDAADALAIAICHLHSARMSGWGLHGMITSASNEQVKAIRKLQERKGRQESGLFYLEGLRIVGEALEAGAEVETLVFAAELLRSEFGQKAGGRVGARGGQVLEVSRRGV